ncbi:hypothetical protein [Actinomadura macrotermitis]|uniref:hypothetical protein n=1 Tax=Actinomadura macrotermitis TaxID=2585200 RepID=UPI00188662BB|nr:hypothetical protein [Actinomadura macrotermitis]
MHPSRLVTTPAGERVDVDEGIWPLVSALWARGWTTVGSCQDMGEAIGRAGAAPPALAELQRGRAWLKMPNAHADAFLAAAAQDPELAVLIRPRLDRPDHWHCYTQRGPAGLLPNAQIYLPASQIGRVVAVLRAGA